MGIEIFKGSENDVLDRFYQTAKKHCADIVVRVTSDCPLVDPKVVDETIEYFLNGECDYVSNNLEKSFPLGLDTEVFTFSALERAWEEASDGFEREHVTTYIKNNPHIFKTKNFKNDVDRSMYRWTVDYESDVEFVKAIYDRLYKPGEVFYMEDVLTLLKENAYLKKLSVRD